MRDAADQTGPALASGSVLPWCKSNLSVSVFPDEEQPVHTGSPGARPTFDVAGLGAEVGGAAFVAPPTPS
jgi:hypothetical protein